MPIINVTLGPANEEMKKRMIKEVTLKMSEITQIPLDKFMMTITELPYENLGLGDQTVKELINSK